jgi:fumarate reductase iron-sulfur subunit
MSDIPVTQLGRTLHLQILRHNPRDPDSEPRLQTFEVEEADAMTLSLWPHSPPSN